MCAVGTNTCSSWQCPALKQSHSRRALQHTFSFLNGELAPASTHFRSFRCEITRQHTFSYLKHRIVTRQHTRTRVYNACESPASTHNYISRRYLYPPAHTFVCLNPVSTHSAFDYFIYHPSAHIFSGSYPLNLQPRILALSVELSRQHTYSGG